MRLKNLAAAGAIVLVFAGCSRSSGSATTDSAAADSIRDAHDAAVAETAATATPATDSVQAAVKSAEGTIGETRKHSGPRMPDSADRDSVIHGPYKTIDSLGVIKRGHSAR